MKKAAPVVPIDPLHPDLSVCREAITLIRKGGIVAFPTDTFYGLAADPFNARAVKRLFKIKGRHPLKPILLLISDIEMLHPLIDYVSPAAKAVMKQFWPGPLTLIFRSASTVSDTLTAKTGTIGVRLPDAAIPVSLIRAGNLPLTATSANHAGEPPATSTEEIKERLGEDIDLILDGGQSGSIPSTLLDVTSPRFKILREGKISSDILKDFLVKI